MKALSLTQPWASLVALGAKQIETRSWSMNYRGVIAIHASKGFPADCRQLCSGSPFYEAIATLPGARDPIHTCLPLGAIVAIATISEVRTTDEMMRLWKSHQVGAVWNWHDEREYKFGDYSERRYAWLLRRAIRLKKPVPCKGSLGLWTVPVEIERQVREMEVAA